MDYNENAIMKIPMKDELSFLHWMLKNRTYDMEIKYKDYKRAMKKLDKEWECDNP